MDGASPGGTRAVPYCLHCLLLSLLLNSNTPAQITAADRAVLLQAFLSARVWTQSDLQAIEGAISKLGSEQFADREKAAEYLVGKGRIAMHTLRLAIRHSDPEVSRRAKDCLDQIDPDADRRMVRDAILELRKMGVNAAWTLARDLAAQAETPEERLELVESALLLEPSLSEDVVNGLAASSRPSDRIIASRIWSGRSDRMIHLMGMLADPDREVRLWAARPLLEAKQVQAIACLVELASFSDDLVGDEACEILMALSGMGAKTLKNGWKGWLASGMPGLDWRRLAVGCRDRGFTVVVLFDGDNGGRVTRLGPDGEVVGEARGLLGPNDVEILPGGRFLIAERNAGKISERNRQGTILWEHSMSGSPVSVARTLQGTVAVATFRDLQEIDREGRVLHSVNHPGGFRAVRMKPDGMMGAVTGDGHLLLINQDWRVVSDVVIKEIGHGAGYWCGLEFLRDDRWLVALGGSGRVAEIDSKGNIHWQAMAPTPVAAHRLANGNTLVSSFEKKALIELDRDGREIRREELQGRPFLVKRY